MGAEQRRTNKELISRFTDFVFMPGFRIKPDSNFCQELQNTFLFPSKVKIVAPRINMQEADLSPWHQYLEAEEGCLKDILSRKNPTFLVLHSLSAVLFSLIVKRNPQILESPNLSHVVLVAPRPQFKKNINFNLVSQLLKMTDSEIKAMYDKFPDDWTEEIFTTSIKLFQHPKISVIIGEKDEITPAKSLDGYNIRDLTVVRGFAHTDGDMVGLNKVIRKIYNQSVKDKMVNI